MIWIKREPAGRLLASGALLALTCMLAGEPARAAADTTFAVVDGAEISAQAFDSMFAAAVRQRFYHGRAPTDQLDALRREVADRMVNRVLLLKEAERREILPDLTKVDTEMAAFEQRNRERPQWREQSSRILPALRQAWQEQSIVEQLEARTRIAPPATGTGLRAYYEAHPEQFTEPERVRLSMILLKVDPSATAAEWEQTLARATDIHEQLKNGADFAQLARLNSGDATASGGGDLGYLHRGMLPPGVETEIGRMAPGSISAPFRLLEGMAIFRLVERAPARLRSFEDVRGKVAELWAREQGEQQWQALIARLRSGAKITYLGGRQYGASSLDASGSERAP